MTYWRRAPDWSSSGCAEADASSAKRFAGLLMSAPPIANIRTAELLVNSVHIPDGDAIIAHCEHAHSSKSYSDLLLAGSQALLAEVDLGCADLASRSDAPGPDLPGAPEDGTGLELKRIHLLSKHGGEGIGAALMRAAISAAREAGAPHPSGPRRKR